MKGVFAPAGLAVALCAATAAPARTTEPGTRPFSACAPLANAARLDALHRPGIDALRCRVAPGLEVAFLSDGTVSWPVVIAGGSPPVSLENPLARRAWFPDTSPVRVVAARGGFRPVRIGGAVRALVFSGVVSRTDGYGNRPIHVAVRLSPTPCLLGVAASAPEAVALARDLRAACLPAVGTD